MRHLVRTVIYNTAKGSGRGCTVSECYGLALVSVVCCLERTRRMAMNVQNHCLGMIPSAVLRLFQGVIEMNESGHGKVTMEGSVHTVTVVSLLGELEQGNIHTRFADEIQTSQNQNDTLFEDGIVYVLARLAASCRHCVHIPSRNCHRAHTRSTRCTLTHSRTHTYKNECSARFLHTHIKSRLH